MRRTTDDISKDKAPPPKGAERANNTKTGKRSGDEKQKIIEQSFEAYSCAHIPLVFYHGYRDLSKVLFNPNAVKIGPY